MMKFLSLSLSLWLFLLLCLQFSGCGPEPLNQASAYQPFVLPSLSGTVFDRDRQSFVADAEVIITPGDHRLWTDATGRFLLPDLMPGLYMASVRKNFELTSVDFQVTETSHVQIQIPFGNGGRGRETIIYREDLVWLEKQSGDLSEHSTPLAHLQNFRQVEDVTPFPFDENRIVFSAKVNPGDRFELYTADLRPDCLNCVERIFSDQLTNLDARFPTLSPDGRRIVFQLGTSLRVATMGLLLTDVTPVIQDDRLNWQKLDSYGQMQPVLERDRLSEVSSAGVTNPAPRVTQTQPALCTATFTEPMWHPRENMLAFLAKPTDVQAPTRSQICQNIATVSQVFILSVVATPDFNSARQITRDGLVKSRLRFNVLNSSLLANLRDESTQPARNFLVEMLPIYTGQYTTVLQAKAQPYDYEISSDGRRLLYVGSDTRTGVSLPQIMEGILFNAELFMPTPKTHYRYQALLSSPRTLRFWPQRY